MHANHITGLFRSFTCGELAELYAARDRAAGLAAEALDHDQVAPLQELQALLRAAVAVALVSELPTALFVESGLLWRAKLDAQRRLWAEQHGEAPDPFSGLSFNLLSYPVSALDAVLVAAAALAPFQLAAHRHFTLAAAAAREVAVPELHEWAAEGRPAILDAGLAALLSADGWAAKLPPSGVASTPPPLQSSNPTEAPIAAGQRIKVFEPAAAHIPPSLQSNDPQEALMAAAQAVREKRDYLTIDQGSRFDDMVSFDAIAGPLATPPAQRIRILGFRSLFRALQLEPELDPRLAPVTAVIQTAWDQRLLPEAAFQVVLRRAVDASLAFLRPTPDSA